MRLVIFICLILWSGSLMAQFGPHQNVNFGGRTTFLGQPVVRDTAFLVVNGTDTCRLRVTVAGVWNSDCVFPSIGVDSIAVLQDSIIVIYEAGVEVSRDTIGYPAFSGGGLDSARVLNDSIFVAYSGGIEVARDTIRLPSGSGVQGVDSIWRVAGIDSFFWRLPTVGTFAIKDSVGSGSLWEAGSGVEAIQMPNIFSPNNASGDYSFAVGGNQTIAGILSSGFGNSHNIQYGSDNSFASGLGNTITGGATRSASFGEGNFLDNGSYQFVGGLNNKSYSVLTTIFGTGNIDTLGSADFIIGVNNRAENCQNCFIGGNGNDVRGGGNLVFGSGHNASSDFNASFGASNNVIGGFGLAAGTSLFSKSSSEIALGSNNRDYTVAGDTSDRQLSIGIGQSFDRNALTILKNGRAGFNTHLPLSDIHISDSTYTGGVHGLHNEKTSRFDDSVRLSYLTPSATQFLQLTSTGNITLATPAGGGGSNWVDTTNGAYIDGFVAINNIANPTIPLDVTGTGTTTNKTAEFKNSTGTANMTLLDNGNLGLGITNPTRRLEVSTNLNGIIESYLANGQTGTSSQVRFTISGNRSEGAIFIPSQNNNTFPYLRNRLVIQTEPLNISGATGALMLIGSKTLTGVPANIQFHATKITGEEFADGNLIMKIDTLGVGIHTTTIAPSAALDVTSTTQGFLPPRMTTVQRNAISAPAEGLMVYDSTLKVIFYFDGTNWVSL